MVEKSPEQMTTTGIFSQVRRVWFILRRMVDTQTAPKCTRLTSFLGHVSSCRKVSEIQDPRIGSQKTLPMIPILSCSFQRMFIFSHSKTLYLNEKTFLNQTLNLSANTLSNDCLQWRRIILYPLFHSGLWLGWMSALTMTIHSDDFDQMPRLCLKPPFLPYKTSIPLFILTCLTYDVSQRPIYQKKIKNKNNDTRWPFSN